MSYVTPASTIRVYRNVPLDNSYEHTIYFGSTGDQSGYFGGLLAHSYSSYTYQRKESNVIKVDELADNLYDCNYLSFENRSGKTFYCFITGIEYVSERCTALTFEIDVFQSYIRDFVIGTCYVVRMHSTTDILGENIQPEPIDPGEMFYEAPESLDASGAALSDLGVVVMICDVDGGSEVVEYQGIISGATVYTFDSSAVSQINALLNEYTEKPESIVAIYMCPKACMAGYGPSGGMATGGSGNQWTDTLTRCTGSEEFGGYVPKNKKLYTYPYNSLLLSDGAGASLTLRYEFWNNFQPSFSFNANCMGTPQITVMPNNYCNMGSSAMCRPMSITMSGYPQCSWNNDAWATYVGNWGLASTLVNGVTGIASGVVSAGFGAATGSAAGVVGGAMQTISGAANTAIQIHQAKIAADTCRGTANCSSALAANGQYDLVGIRQHCAADVAETIDDYFTRFGYAQNKIMSPVLNARPAWTYIQTAGCSLLPLNGMPPADAQATICAAMDRGMTWWRSNVTIGDYSQDNSI